MCTYSVHKGGSGADVFRSLVHAPAHATCRLLGPGGLLEPEGVGGHLESEGVGVEEEVVAGHPEPEGVAGHPEPEGVEVHHPPEGEVVLGHLHWEVVGVPGHLFPIYQD